MIKYFYKLEMIRSEIHFYVEFCCVQNKTSVLHHFFNTKSFLLLNYTEQNISDEVGRL